MSIIETINESWNWAGLAPESIVVDNKFGNAIVKDIDGAYWRICPEEAEVNIIASSEEQLKSMWDDEDFRVDWLMSNLVEEAENKFGELADGRKFCLKVLGVLGGEYDISNVGTISFDELISFSGHVAKEIDGLPDGSQIQFDLCE